MATNFPTSLDTLTNPTATDTLDSPPHDTQHADANDAIEALEAKVGVDSSAVTTSLDYRVGQLELGGGSMTTSSTAPSSPSDGDMWYDTDDGRTYVYYDDGTSQQWVEFGAPAVAHGKILQIVRATDTTNRTTTSGSFVDANISVTITPTSATSDILLIWSAFLDISGTGSSNVAVMGITDSANNVISGAEDAQFGLITADRSVTTGTAIAYDSPATTSATTYKGRFRVSTTTTCEIKNSSNTGQLFALEVGA